MFEMMKGIHVSIKGDYEAIVTVQADHSSKNPLFW